MSCGRYSLQEPRPMLSRHTRPVSHLLCRLLFLRGRVGGWTMSKHEVEGRREAHVERRTFAPHVHGGCELANADLPHVLTCGEILKNQRFPGFGGGGCAHSAALTSSKQVSSSAQPQTRVQIGFLFSRGAELKAFGKSPTRTVG